jgi:hypothetical protein
MSAIGISFVIPDDWGQAAFLHGFTHGSKRGTASLCQRHSSATLGNIAWRGVPGTCLFPPSPWGVVLVGNRAIIIGNLIEPIA